ncbi:hypothetical protein VTL71DRAFT_13019 [Oculimacula yallundae]|uniref:Zn(2)-C6 fungal-type domain-containing protein n=1 Tax=Oculimacula yallundae TaxID=86028 RepID=A0ABR4CPC7_9HELO
MSDVASPPSPNKGPTSNVKAIKKKAFSCDQCRVRKVRCGGEQPICRRCVIRKDPCRYLLAPTISYTQKLENKVKELQAVIETLQNPGPVEAEGYLESQAQSRTARSSEPGESSHDGPGTFDGLKRDEKGGITYHGATSFFQLPAPAGEALASEHVLSEALDAAGKDRKERLITNAWTQRAMETFSETPPLFNFVYRPAFTRDMEVLGSYYSHTLLNAMLSHSVRWCKNDAKIRELLVPYENGELFSRQARTLLFDELKQGDSKVPTVQTLLLLSAQECSAGNRTQAWLYSGMAFRLIEDMGMCIDGQKYAGAVHLSDEDIEIRHRLFWGCYLWDKMISLYLGRSPTLQHSDISPPQIMLDDSAETEIWKPHGIVYPDGFGYPPTQAHSISCFMRMCQLSKIFNQILIHIYDPLGRNSEAEVEACLATESRALELFWDDLPPFLRIDAKDLPSHCPPSHIVTLNCLYHTFKILLYRPILFQRRSTPSSAQQRPDPHHLVECLSSATSIIAIFDLFCRTFGDEYCILALSYSVYTAASIFLLQIQAVGPGLQDGITMKRMEFCVKALKRVSEINTVIASSLKLITQALSKLNIHIPTDRMTKFSHPSNDQTHRQNQMTHENRFLPLTTEPAQAIPNYNSSSFDLDGGAYKLPNFPNWQLLNWPRLEQLGSQHYLIIHHEGYPTQERITDHQNEGCIGVRAWPTVSLTNLGAAPLENAAIPSLLHLLAAQSVIPLYPPLALCILVFISSNCDVGWLVWEDYMALGKRLSLFIYISGPSPGPMYSIASRLKIRAASSASRAYWTFFFLNCHYFVMFNFDVNRYHVFSILVIAAGRILKGYDEGGFSASTILPSFKNDEYGAALVLPVAVMRVTPNVFVSLQVWGAYVFWAGVCAAGFVLFGVWAPETKSVPMERMEELFAGKWYLG